MIATATARSVSPRRQAALILEATATAVCLVLLGWLLLWFILYKAGAPQIHALFVRAHDLGVLYQERDAQSLDAHYNDLKKANLEGALVNRVERSASPCLVYVSAPALGIDKEAKVRDDLVGDDQKAPTILGLIQTVAKSARGDVLLAIDSAQVGSDRDLAIFGNSPYHGLAEALENLGPRPNHRLAVVLSCQPGEVSLIHQGEGRSLFAAALAHVLHESPGPTIGVQELYDQVHNLVANAAATDLKASQTPQLIVVGRPSADPDALRFRIGLPRLRPVAGNEAALPAKVTGLAAARGQGQGPAQAKEAAPAEAKEAAAQPPPAEDPSANIQKALIAEWTEYDKVRGDAGKPDPEVVAPVELRRYEAALDRAERLVRQALRDPLPASINLANEAIAATKGPRKQLTDRLNDPKPNPGVPFQPIGDGQWGEVVALVRDLTTKAAEGKGSEEGPSALAKELKQASMLYSGKGGGYPATHLELQLPLWAKVYLANFAGYGDLKAFEGSNGKASQLLLRATEARKDAERALASVDLGGLGWIQDAIKKGDEDRRIVQDGIFDPRLGGSAAVSGPLFAEWNKQIDNYRTRYEAAYALAQIERKARVAIARALYELPGLGDRLVLSQPERSSVPAELVSAFDAASELLTKLREDPRGAVPQDVRGRTNALEAPLDKLTKSMQALEQAADPGKLAIEDQLRVSSPRLKAEQRAESLKRWVNDHPLGRINWVSSPPKEEAESGAGARNFWNVAFGLAWIDTGLRGRFSGEVLFDEAKRAQEDERRIGQGWGETAARPGDPSSAAEDRTEQRLKTLAAIGQRAARAASQLGEREPQAPAKAEDGRRTPALWEISFRRALEVARLDSQKWSAADPFAHALLQFHAERLRDDYVQGPRLNELGGSAITARENPFQPRFGTFASKTIAVTGELDVPVEFARSGADAPPGRKAILAVQLTESPAPKEGPATSFTLKDKEEAGGTGQPTHLVAVGGAGHVFQLVRQTGVNRADRLDLECKTFFSGLVADDPKGGREVAVQKPVGKLFRVTLVPNEEYLRNNQKYIDADIERIKTHYVNNNKNSKRYAWFGQPFYYSVEIERLKAEAPDKVWIRTVMVSGKAPEDKALLIDGKEGPWPLSVGRKVGSTALVENTEFIHQDDVPKLGGKEKPTILKVQIFDEEKALTPISQEQFEVRSVRMFDCLTFSKGEKVDKSQHGGKPFKLGENYFDQVYQVTVSRDGPGKDLVSEPIRGEELVVYLVTEDDGRKSENRKELPGHLPLWPDNTVDRSINFQSGLSGRHRPSSYRIDRLGFNGVETQDDKSISEPHPYRGKP